MSARFDEVSNNSLTALAADCGLLLNTDQAAALLQMSPRTLARMRQEGTGPPYIKAGRRVLYTQPGIFSWLNDRVVSSTAEARAKGLQRGR